MGGIRPRPTSGDKSSTAIHESGRPSWERGMTPVGASRAVVAAKPERPLWVRCEPGEQAFASPEIGRALPGSCELFERALALNPNSARARIAKGYVDKRQSRTDPAIEGLQRATRLSSLDPPRRAFTAALAMAQCCSGSGREPRSKSTA